MDERNQEFSLESVISTAIAIPGVKVKRNEFLTECFKNEAVDIHEILENGPVNANCSREMLSRLANNLIMKRTSESSIASFVAGLPGGFAMGVAIPMDVLQFFAVALRLAQELSYLYGAHDLWRDGQVDPTLVNGQLILYCGVMFGVTGAAHGVRLLSAQLAKTAAKRIPQQALTKTFWYPIVKQIGKALSIKVTKSSVANGIAKVIPVIGGVISGGLTFASMLPMGKRLAATLDDANFDYSEDEITEDIIYIETLENEESPEATGKSSVIKNRATSVTKGLKGVGSGVSGAFSKMQKTVTGSKKAKRNADSEGTDPLKLIEKLAKLRDSGVLTQEEFEEKKAELLEKI